jgi:hypothetical protein
LDRPCVGVVMSFRLNEERLKLKIWDESNRDHCNIVIKDSNDIFLCYKSLKLEIAEYQLFDIIMEFIDKYQDRKTILDEEE